ncbi:MAG: zinc ribbon domain-containing protein, partial [Tepidisphaeraceae bacterium]
TEKVDRAKSEEELLKTMQLVENTQGELKALAEHLTGEEQKAATMKAGVGDKVATLQAEIDSLKPEREQAAAALDKKALAAFDRLADHHDGEAMARLIKPDKRREEYACGACMMDLVTDVYNRLHSRDELVFCPSCRRILYIPEDLPLEQAVHKKKPQKEYRGEKGLGAPVVRQQSAEDVLNSIQVEDDTPTEAAPTEASESQPVSETEETSPNTNL